MSEPVAQPVVEPPQPTVPKTRRWLNRLGFILVLAGLCGGGVYAWRYSAWAAGRSLAVVEGHLERWQLRDAQTALAIAQERWPDHPQVHFLAGRIARLQQRYPEARDALFHSVRLGGDYDASQRELILIDVSRGPVAPEIESGLLRLVAEEHADAVFILDALVTGARTTFRFDKAQTLIRAWLEHLPDSIPAWMHKGWLFERAHRTEEAVECYRKVLDLDAGHETARLHLTEILVAQHNPDEAMPHLDILERQRPGDSLVLLGRARCWYLMGQNAKAIELLDRVLESDPDDPGALSQRAQLAMASRDWAAAEGFLRRTIVYKPFEHRHFHTLHQCLLAQGKQAQAEETLTRANQIKTDLDRIQTIVSIELPQAPRDPAPRFEAASILMRHGAYAEAVRWLRSALAEDPTHAPSRQALAECQGK